MRCFLKLKKTFYLCVLRVLCGEKVLRALMAEAQG